MVSSKQGIYGCLLRKPQMAIQFFLKEMNADIKPHTDSTAGLERRPWPSAQEAT